MTATHLCTSHFAMDSRLGFGLKFVLGCPAGGLQLNPRSFLGVEVQGLMDQSEPYWGTVGSTFQ